MMFVRKPTRPSLPLRKAPHLSPSLSLLRRERMCANRPFNSLYDPFGSPCRGQKRCSNRYAIRLADHQRSALDCANKLIPLSNSVLLYHFSDIRDFIKYGITNLIIWKFTTFTQISYKISAFTTKIRLDGFIRQELLILFFQRNHFLYHVDTNMSFIFIICHNCITVKPYQTLLPKACNFDRICCFLSFGKFGLESNFCISAFALEARALFSDAL